MNDDPVTAACEPCPDVYLAGQLFSAGELSAMALDGLVEPVFGSAFRGAETPDSPGVRATALALHCPPALAQRAVLGRGTAAWVYGCGPPPERIQLLVNSARRTTALGHVSGCRVHEVRLGPYDAVRICGVGVTTALRTAVDVAMHEPHVLATPILLAMGSRQPLNCPLGTVRGAVALGDHVPGKRAAMALLDALINESWH